MIVYTAEKLFMKEKLFSFILFLSKGIRCLAGVCRKVKISTNRDLFLSLVNL